MSTLLEKRIKVNRIVTTSIDQAHAINDPARAKIIELLYRKELNADQITKNLKKAGYKKALTTVRHHLEILKKSGLIELVRIEEARGAITKYYGTTTKLLGYDAPKDFESQYSSAIKNTTKRIEDILKNLAPKAIKTKKGSSDPKYAQYVLVEILNRAMTRVMENSNTIRKSKKK